MFSYLENKYGTTPGMTPLECRTLASEWHRQHPEEERDEAAGFVDFSEEDED